MLKNRKFEVQALSLDTIMDASSATSLNSNTTNNFSSNELEEKKPFFLKKSKHNFNLNVSCSTESLNSNNNE